MTDTERLQKIVNDLRWQILAKVNRIDALEYALSLIRNEVQYWQHQVLAFPETPNIEKANFRWVPGHWEAGDDELTLATETSKK